MSDEEGSEDHRKGGPRRERAEEVPLGIRRRGPDFDPKQFIDRQLREDDERDKELLRRAEDEPLEAPELHRDYEIRDGEEYDRHLEEITSVNALKELILQAREELEEELETTIKPYTPERMDELMVFTKEAFIGHGEDRGYEKLKDRLKQLLEDDVAFAQAELDRKKDAYLRSAGK